MLYNIIFRHHLVKASRHRGLRVEYRQKYLYPGRSFDICIGIRVKCPLSCFSNYGTLMCQKSELSIRTFFLQNHFGLSRLHGISKANPSKINLLKD